MLSTSAIVKIMEAAPGSVKGRSDMQVYAVNFHGESTRDGYWTAGVFTDEAKAERVAAWLNELMKLNDGLWQREMEREDPSRQRDRTPAQKVMGEVVGIEGYYEVVPEEVHETAAGWMEAHSLKDPGGMSDWPQVDIIEKGLADTEPPHALSEEARQLRMF